jgi:hypothetical protein
MSLATLYAVRRRVINEFERNLVWRKPNPVALVRKQTIPAERPPLVGEISANFCG